MAALTFTVEVTTSPMSDLDGQESYSAVATFYPDDRDPRQTGDGFREFGIGSTPEAAAKMAVEDATRKARGAG